MNNNNVHQIAWITNGNDLFINRLDFIDVLLNFQYNAGRAAIKYKRLIRYFTSFGEPTDMHDGDNCELVVRVTGKSHVGELIIGCIYAEEDGVYFKITDLLRIFLKSKSIDVAIRHCCLFLTDFLAAHIKDVGRHAE